MKCSFYFSNLVLAAAKALEFKVKGRNIDDILSNFAAFWRELTSESQLRWVRSRI
jgi:L-fuconate dehydratase